MSVDRLAVWKDLCLAARDQRALGEFWAEVIGLEVESSPGKVSLEGPTPGHRIWVNHVDRPKTVKNRVHPDVYAGSVADLEALGATVLAPAEVTGFGWTVMADPEGGEFCCFVRDGGDGRPLPAYRLHGIVVDCADPDATARWWGRVLGVEPTTYDGRSEATLEHVTPDEVLTLDFVPVPEAKREPNRVHWDVSGDVDRLLAAGATRLWEMPDWAVLADPEGNEFCCFPPDRMSP